MSGEPISRRRALGLLTVGAASVATGATGLAIHSGGPGEDIGLSSPGASGRPLGDVAEVKSQDGVLALELRAAPGARLAGRDTAALGYNGISPGPTLRVRPGDVLRIRLVNGLDQPTNLHTHGLHVSPEGRGDNPFVQIEPGEAFDYEIPIPRSHPPGTYWYHPHHHGTVADQVFGGLAGALVVEGGPPLASRERLLVVTDTTLDDRGGVVQVDAMSRMMGREGRLVLVNGQHQPAIQAAPGTAERWRVINGCVSRVLALRLDAHDLTQIALDGRLLPVPTVSESIVLAPGNRADLLVRPTTSGTYSLISDAFSRGGMMGGGPMATGRVVLATLEVSGRAADSPPLPTRLSAPPVPLGPVVRQREITFGMGMGMGMGRDGMGPGGMMSHTIDGRTFDPKRDDQVIQLNTTEEWTVFNTSPLVHPFHLHVWPAHLVEDSTGRAPIGVLRDVVTIPARGWVRLRIPFHDYPGRSVYHCHILDHEDAGMMAVAHVR